MKAVTLWGHRMAPQCAVGVFPLKNCWFGTLSYADGRCLPRTVALTTASSPPLFLQFGPFTYSVVSHFWAVSELVSPWLCRLMFVWMFCPVLRWVSACVGVFFGWVCFFCFFSLVCCCLSQKQKLFTIRCLCGSCLSRRRLQESPVLCLYSASVGVWSYCNVCSSPSKTTNTSYITASWNQGTWLDGSGFKRSI